MARRSLSRREFGIASASAVAGALVLGHQVGIAQDATPAPEGSPSGGPAYVPPAGVTVYAEGLLNPRYITFDGEDTLYISEAGDGGTDAHYAPAGEGTPAATEALSYSGLTGQVTKITTAGERSVLTGGLPSYTFGSEIVGPAGIVFADSKLYLGIGGPGPATALIEPMPMQDSVVAIDVSTGTATLVADIGAYERASNPDPNAVDSNLYGTTIGEDGMIYQADAGGNTVYKVDPASGTLSVLAVLPGVPMPGFKNPERGGAEEIDPVPTGVAAAPGGGVYVGELTGGPFPPGAASVLKIGDDGSISTVAKGLTMVTGVTTASDGTIYAVQISENFLAQPPAPGSLVKIDPTTGAVTPVLGGLPIPNDVAFDSQGNAYVVIFTTAAQGTPPMGMILKVDLTQLGPVGTPDAGTGSEATPDSSTATGGGTVLELETVDIAFKPTKLEAPAGDITV
ncbi:MAG TPA: ScyD/ScyE family protein, partial [Thermomicrobiales bacterium]|nr:ScyD/ScyE family protein [Thermomicrobiales bacterium]